MVVKGANSGGQHERHIEALGSTIRCLSGIQIVFSGMLFVITFYLLVWDSGLQEWVESLHIGEFNIGLYVLAPLSILMIVAALLGGFVAFQENPQGLMVNVGVQSICFVLGLLGSIVLIMFSAHGSAIMKIIHNSMTDLIVNSNRDSYSQVLRLLQESIGCCGATGPMDYSNMKKPLPTECRDSVTGNAYFHGCVDQLTWFLEDRSFWVVALTLLLCFVHVVQAVLSLVLAQAIQKTDANEAGFRR